MTSWKQLQQTLALIAGLGLVVPTTAFSEDRAQPAARAAAPKAISPDIALTAEGAFRGSLIDGSKKPMADVTEADYERSHRANTKAVLFVMQESARRMADGGRIIHIGTSLTAGSAPNYALYAGTKAPAEEFTRMLSKEIGKRGITVNNIAPGPLDNSFYHAAETPQTAAIAANFSVAGRLGKESDITPVVEFLASPQSQWVTGQVLWVNGGYLTR